MQSFYNIKSIFIARDLAMRRFYTGMDIERLIERAKDGDEQALGDLYKTFAPRMKGVCCKILKNDKGVADDLVHDAFVLAFASLDKLNEPRKFGQWLSIITRNVTLKYIENVQRHSVVPLSVIADEKVYKADEATTAAADFSYEELLSAIESLPKGYKNVFKLSVIEGLSHQEIADMLGIEPHSSSSQLYRAKMMLRKILLNYKSLAVIVIAIISILLYRFFAIKEEKPIEGKSVMKKKDNKQKEHKVDEEIREPHYIAAEEKHIKQGYIIKQEADTTLITVVDTLSSKDQQTERLEEVYRTDDVFVAETSVDSLMKNEPTLLPEVDIVMKEKRKNGWGLLAAGSLGPALAQNVYQIFAGGGIGSTDKDGPGAIPEDITNWEDYYNYLSSIKDPTPDTLMLTDIAKNNSGEIIERENHERPITFALSYAKKFNDRWSIETGLQYSLLKSSFMLGREGYNVCRYQKIHYIGIPLRMYYRFAGYKNFSAYGAAGMTLNIPVSSNIECRYSVTEADALTVLAEKWHIDPPLQWSVNTSVGLQYKFTPNIGLYVEPTFNYYIPTGSSYHTIWTERPVTLSVPFGIRFTW